MHLLADFVYGKMTTKTGIESGINKDVEGA